MADQTITTFNPDTAREILAMLAEWKCGRQQNENRPHVPESVPQTPEVYLALAPSGGIPAAGGTGTADVLSSADCDIYQIIRSNPTQLVKVNTLFKKVYNISSSDISGGSLITVVRDKFGTWVAVPESSALQSGYVTLDSDFNFSSEATALSVTLTGTGIWAISADVAYFYDVTADGHIFASILSQTITPYYLGPWTAGQGPTGGAILGWRLNGAALSGSGGTWSGGPTYMTDVPGQYDLRLTRGGSGTWTTSKATNGAGLRSPTTLRWVKLV